MGDSNCAGQLNKLAHLQRRVVQMSLPIEDTAGFSNPEGFFRELNPYNSPMNRAKSLMLSYPLKKILCLLPGFAV